MARTKKNEKMRGVMQGKEEKVIDTLCLGVYARILLKCCRSGVSQRQIMTSLLGTIDPDNHCSGIETEGDQDHFVSKLMSCKINIPSSGSNVTSAVSLARSLNVNEISEKFNSLIDLLDNDKRRAIIGALYQVFNEDKSLKNEHKELFMQCMGNTVENVLNSHRINFSHFLAGVLLYVVLVNDNKRGTSFITAVKKWDIVEKYSDFDIVFTQNTETSDFPEWKYPDGLSNYMKRLKSQYNEIPTLLHEEPFRPFRDYYVLNDVMIRVKEQLNQYGSISNVVREVKMENITLEQTLDISHRIILSGEGGLGKSMLMRHLLLSCIDDYERLGIIPLFITLKDYESNYESIIEYICYTLQNMWPEANTESIEAILEHGTALLLFDGLDEISRDNFIAFTKKLNDFTIKYLENFFIISSRPYSQFNSFHGFSLIQLQFFTKEQALEMIDRYNYFANAPKIQKKFRELVDTKLYYTHKEFSNNPLLLSIMMFVFKNEAEMPTEKYRFYERAYAVLSIEHDASKDQYVRRLTTGLNANQFAICFSYFCAASYAESKVSFALDDIKRYLARLRKKVEDGKIAGITLAEISAITPEQFAYDASNNLCLFYRENLSYVFMHRSFQEYFCARYFHSLLDRELQRVIKLFDKNDLRKKEDLTLPMLYDMKPAAIEAYMFVPYLQNLFEQCDREYKIWTFLETIYSNYQVADGEADVADEYCLPKSNLYLFIHNHYKVPELFVNIEDFPEKSTLIIDELVYSNATKEIMWEDEFYSWYNKNINVTDPDLIADGYGNPYGSYENYKEQEAEVRGYLYEFDWKKIKNSKYKKLIEAIEDKEKPFMKEYLAMKDLLSYLQEKVTRESDNDDLEGVL